MNTLILFAIICDISFVRGSQKPALLNNIEFMVSEEVMASYICKANQSWCIPPDYHKEEEPWKFRHFSNSDLPFNYEFFFYILEVEQINDMDQTITISYYFRVKWMEPRLFIDKDHSDWNKTDRISGALSYQTSILKIFWVPDLEINRLKKFGSQNILEEMSGVEIFKSQHIKYNAKVDTTFSCKMDFDRYPFDYHSCPFTILSYLFTEKIINCSSAFAYTVENQRNLQHHVDITDLAPENRYVGVQGNRFAMCGFTINLHRNRVQIFFQVYLTCILFVIVSWASFIINPEVVPGRMGLLVTIFLVLINIFNGAKLNEPISSFLNAIDIYILGCIGHVFLVLSEYVVVLAMEKFSLECKRKVFNSQKESRKTKACLKNLFSRHRLDTNSIFIFPIIFTLFNLAYWSNFS